MLNRFDSIARAALLAAFLSVTFYAFRSTTLIGDGLRLLPALRTITGQSPPAFEPKPWLEVYRAHYERVVVHNHFLFGLLMRAAFAIARSLGSRADAVSAIQVVNALCAGVAGALFFLLALRIGVSRGIALAVTVGVCISPVYLLAATNIAEVAPSLPFFIGTLLALSGRELSEGSVALLGFLAALAAITYLLAGSLVPCIAAALVVACRFSIRYFGRMVASFLTVFALIFFGIWTLVLFLSGIHRPLDLITAIMRFPQQGTYGGFKLGSLAATPVGLMQSFFSILPEDFRGLRFLYHDHPSFTMLCCVISLVLILILGWAVYELVHAGMILRPVVLSSLLAFLLVEAACVEWDPYYPKLQIFAVILFFLIVAVAFARDGVEKWQRGLLVILVGAVVVAGSGVLRRNIQPSQPRKNAEQLYSIVGNGVLITGWASDVAHIWLYSNGENIIPLPDFALARNLKSNRVQMDLNAIIEQAKAERRNVYFYGVFDDGGSELPDIYETRFRLTGFGAYLHAFQQKAHPVASLPQPSGHLALLYAYDP